MNSEELREFAFAGEAVDDGDRLLVDRAHRGVDRNVVQLQEQQCSNGSRPLVAINKWMILHDMEQVGSRHFEGKLMQELSTECGLRLRDGRLQ